MNSRSTQKRSRFATVAIAVGAALLATTVGPIAAANAAENIVVDQDFPYPPGTTMSHSPGTDLIAQPFIPTQTGALDNVTITVFAHSDPEFTRLAIHNIEDSGEVAADPIPGGEGTLSFGPAGEAEGTTTTTATASFADRPIIEAGTRYAILIDPAVREGGTETGAIFPTTFSSDADYFVKQKRGDLWENGGNTAHLYFSVSLAIPIPDTVATPQSPTVQPAPECTVDTAGKTLQSSVTAPASGGGITYSDVTISDNTATLTATAEDGYTLTGAELGTGWTLNTDGTATWTQELATVACDSVATIAQPVITAPECTVDTAGKTLQSSVTAPAAGGGITYSDVTITGNTATITATAEDGYTLTGAELGTGWTLNTDGTATWTQELTTVACDSVATIAQPVVTAPECTVDTAGKTLQSSVTAPASGDGITYSDVTISDNTATITATVDDGYTLTGAELGTGWTLNTDGTATWTQELATASCAAPPTEEPPAKETPKLPAEKTPAGPAKAQPQQPLANSGSLTPIGLATAGALLIALGATVTISRRKLPADH